MTVLIILRHLSVFYNVLSHCLWLKYCRGCLIWIANGPNLHFVQKYLCFILLRRDLNISGCETDGKLTCLCCSSIDVLPSRSSSRSRDWKLWIDRHAAWLYVKGPFTEAHTFIRICRPFSSSMALASGYSVSASIRSSLDRQKRSE